MLKGVCNMRKEFGSNPWFYPLPVLILGTYDAQGVPDAMNAAWGGLYDSNLVEICPKNISTTIWQKWANTSQKSVIRSFLCFGLINFSFSVLIYAIEVYTVPKTGRQNWVIKRSKLFIPNKRCSLFLNKKLGGFYVLFIKIGGCLRTFHKNWGVFTYFS